MTVSPGYPAKGLAPVSTLIPGIIPCWLKYAGKGTPPLVFCRSVSSYKITPLIYSLAPGVVNSISR